MGVRGFHDESCRKRFDRIHFHTADAPSVTPVLAPDEVLEASEAPAGADTSEAPAGAVAEEEGGAGPSSSSSGVKRRDDDNGSGDSRSVKRATTTAEDTEMESAQRKRKDQALDSPPGLESAAGASAAAADPAGHRSSDKRRRVAARIEEAVEGAMQTGDVGMIMAVQEAIEPDEGEQDEPDEIWGGKEWLDPRLVKEGRLDELRRPKHFDVYEVVDDGVATGHVVDGGLIGRKAVWREAGSLRGSLRQSPWSTWLLVHEMLQYSGPYCRTWRRTKTRCCSWRMSLRRTTKRQW